jgi:hypothetical protein
MMDIFLICSIRNHNCAEGENGIMIKIIHFWILLFEVL